MNRPTGESRYPGNETASQTEWTPAFAGVTK